MNFKDYINKDRLKVLTSDNKEGALMELIDLVALSEEIKNKKKIQEGIFHREQLMSTGIGLGIAIPHVRIEGVEDFIIAVGINSQGIKDYQSIDDIPVKIIFLIIGNKDKTKEYLQILSDIVKFLKEKDTRQVLLNRFLHSAFGGSAMKLVTQALGNSKPSKKEIAKIRELLNEIEGKKK